jgi:hypothetical protein
MKAILHIEKILVRGQKQIRITKFENLLHHESMPIEYLEGFDYWPKTNAPAMGMYANELCMYIPEDAFPQSLKEFVHELSKNPKNPGILQIDVTVGSIISEEGLKDLLKWMKRAGERLTKINKKLAEENKGWEGTKTFEI